MDKDQIIAQLREENAKLREEIAKLKAKRARTHGEELERGSPFDVFHLPNTPTPDCSICAESTATCTSASQLSCGHQFHRDCFHEWVDACAMSDHMRVTCPLCRRFLAYFKITQPSWAERARSWFALGVPTRWRPSLR
jgi:hypothetical protein